VGRRLLVVNLLVVNLPVVNLLVLNLLVLNLLVLNLLVVNLLVVNLLVLNLLVVNPLVVNLLVVRRLLVKAHRPDNQAAEENKREAPALNRSFRRRMFAGDNNEEKHSSFPCSNCCTWLFAGS
jgi:hypothetical protein